MFVMLYDISRNWKKKNIFPKSTGLPDLYQQYTQKQVLDIIREIYIDDNSNRNELWAYYYHESQIAKEVL